VLPNPKALSVSESVSPSAVSVAFLRYTADAR
jgi:hypothetical protein